MRKPVSSKIRLRVIVWLSLLLMAAGNTPLMASQVERAKDRSVTIASVSTHALSNRTVISIAADGPLSRRQTWQDGEGYHVVVLAATARNNIKGEPGIKLRQLGTSLEILVETKPGSNISVRSLSNRLNVTVDGKLEPRDPPKYAHANSSAPEFAPGQGDSERAQEASQTIGSRTPPSRETATTGNQAVAGNVLIAQNSADAPAGNIGTAANSPDVTAPVTDQPEQNDGWFSAIFSDSWILGVIGLGLLFLLAARRLRARRLAAEIGWIDVSSEEFDPLEDLQRRTDSAPIRSPTSGHHDALVKQNGSGGSEGASPQRKSPASAPAATPAPLFGAYRVDQEVGKLVLGLPHRMDVLGSRGPDDRRAIEASLLKALTSLGTDDNERRRAREALEEYGFVARQSALLLLAPDPYERTSVAKILGDIKSPASLPFLLEALYDHESIVRNQAVLSIGELKLPAAIGALLDIARKHTDVPGTLLSRALSACSLGGLDFFDSPIPEPGLLSGGSSEALAHEFTQLEPASVVQDLPESSDDERLTAALAKLNSDDLGERSEAIKSLAQFRVRSSVAALGRVARLDQEASVRALAISSLASINHESVFPFVLIGMADESREVRAAAARCLSRLSFDRADAYVRVIETHDADVLRDVAQACIKAGIVAQGIDRLASNDRHQVYEAFSIVSLLAKANMIEPILDAIADHPNLDLRLTAVRLLGTTGQPAVLDQFRRLAERKGMPEAVKHALLETINKTDEARNKGSQTPAEVAGHPHENQV